MLRLSPADAVASLREAMNTLPTDLDARADFFVQWRARTVAALELIFNGDHETVRQFKEIEFSPRRLTKNEAKDAQLKLDAYLAGCAASRAFLESLAGRVMTVVPEPPAPPPVQPTGEPTARSDSMGIVAVAHSILPVSPEPGTLERRPQPAAEERPLVHPAPANERLVRQLQRIEDKLDQLIAASYRVAVQQI